MVGARHGLFVCLIHMNVIKNLTWAERLLKKLIFIPVFDVEMNSFHRLGQFIIFLISNFFISDENLTFGQIQQAVFKCFKLSCSSSKYFMKQVTCYRYQCYMHLKFCQASSLFPKIISFGISCNLHIFLVLLSTPVDTEAQNICCYR